jgi:murein DD-endopeptidase MepM/ murein hydrolase activator NlpD
VAVAYAGKGIRAYGNLLIIKHGNDYLTAYAHNQTLLVKEGQAVKAGQQIATWGIPVATATCCISSYAARDKPSTR